MQPISRYFRFELCVLVGRSVMHLGGLNCSARHGGSDRRSANLFQRLHLVMSFFAQRRHVARADDLDCCCCCCCCGLLLLLLMGSESPRQQPASAPSPRSPVRCPSLHAVWNYSPTAAAAAAAAVSSCNCDVTPSDVTMLYEGPVTLASEIGKRLRTSLGRHLT